MRSIFTLFVILFGLTACSPLITDYKGTGPTLIMEEFFNGDLIAYGMVQDRSGKVLRRFRVDMVGSWKNEDGILKGTLEEDFYYDDGEFQQRTWYLEKTAANSYRGTASDVTKDASGTTEGFALNWHYTLAIPVGERVWNIDFDDWMYLLDDQRLINRAEMKKWGIRVGEVTLMIEKT